MTTRALVPNADGEGSLGVENLKWGAVYVSSPDKEDNSQKVPSTAWVQAIMAEARQSIMAEVYGGLSGTSLPSTAACVGQPFTLDRGDVSDGYERFVKYVCTNVTGNVPTWTTEFLLDPAHAVSTVLWTGTIATNPGTVYGGTWEPLPAGYTLIAAGKGKDEFGDFEYVAGEKYGERMHRLTAGEMAKIEGELRNIPQQENGVPIFTKGVFSYDQSVREGHGYATGMLRDELDLIRFRAGNDQPHNNVPPCLATYCWRRQA